MVFQAFVDDSFKDDALVFAGHIATAEAWANFTKDWEQLLEFVPVDKNGKRAFKMSAFPRDADGMWKLKAFCNVIEQHIPLSISCYVKKSDLIEARSQIYIPGGRIDDWGEIQHIYMIGYKGIIGTLAPKGRSLIKNIVPEDQSIDLIFDEQSNKNLVWSAWNRHKAANEQELLGLFGAAPRFEDDKQFLALQAADLWAWWVRQWYAEGDADRKIRDSDFGAFSYPNSARRKLNGVLTKDIIVKELLKIAWLTYAENPYGIPYKVSIQWMSS